MSLSLYELDGMLLEAIAAAEEKINPETGEIPEDWAEFLDAIQGQRDIKALNIARWIKSMEAEAEAIKTEKTKLAQRQSAIETKSERVRNWLARFVQPGEKLKDANTAIGWRKSSSVEVLREDNLPEAAFKIVRTVQKTIVRELLEKGAIGADEARIVERQSIQIK